MTDEPRPRSTDRVGPDDGVCEASVPRRAALRAGTLAALGVGAVGWGAGPATGQQDLPAQRATPTADDADSDDRFGASVAVASDGTTALVGAPDDEDPNGDFAGSAYVFVRADGGWTQQAKLVADDGDSSDGFGTGVSVTSDGATALVGAPGDEDPNFFAGGSAYVFERSGGTWTQHAKLAAADGDSSDRFGAAVALSGDGSSAFVGATDDEDPNGSGAGSAYAFARADDGWTQAAKLVADDGDSTDRFGEAVSASADGTTVLVGAQNDEDPNGSYAGSVYAFEYGTDTWTQTAKLVATDGDAEDGFGTSISVSADGATALVGTLDDEDPNGSAYVFERSGGAWTQAANFVAADGDSQDGFGATVALSADGTTGLVGAAGDDDPNGLNAGSAYVFDRAGGAWTQRVKLAADDGDNQDQFGRAVSVSADGTTGLVGAMGDEGPSGGADAGSAYVFELAALDGPAVDGRPARDADGDGRYEDVDGDGRQSFDDVVTLFESLDAPSVESNPDAFDFNRNGRLDFDDLLALFRSISG